MSKEEISSHNTMQMSLQTLDHNVLEQLDIPTIYGLLMKATVGAEMSTSSVNCGLMFISKLQAAQAPP